MPNIPHILLIFIQVIGPNTDFLADLVMARVHKVRIISTTIFFESKRIVFEARRVVLWSKESHNKGEDRDGSEEDAVINQRKEEKVSDMRKRKRISNLPLNFRIIRNNFPLNLRSEMISSGYAG